MHRTESTGYARDVATAMDNRVDRKDREEMIRRRAYFSADKCSFALAHELQDRLRAEWDIDREQKIRLQVALTGTKTA
jgi:hypothetical protein